MRDRCAGTRYTGTTKMVLLYCTYRYYHLGTLILKKIKIKNCSSRFLYILHTVAHECGGGTPVTSSVYTCYLCVYQM